MEEIVALGLMSGTSMDGIDLALLATDGERRVTRGPSFFVAYESDFRQRLERGLEEASGIAERGDRPGTLSELERDLTLRHADAVRAFLARQSGRWATPSLIGFHGQTVLHRPERHLTVQLGDGHLLARETLVPVIYDMRANDMLHGGQGAPLVPAYHAALASSIPATYADRLPLAFVNIGGISNVTYVPRHGVPLAFDSGPGNNLIDRWMQREAGLPYDADGAIAGDGSIVFPVVQQYLESPFFSRPAPKSLDRADFTLDFVEGLELSDGARTLAAVAADAVVLAAQHMPEQPRLWIVCGGGRKNPHILQDMRNAAGRTGAEVVVAEDVGLDGDATEAEAWAFLAVRSARGLPLTFPGTTGCREPVTGGIRAES